MAAAKYLRQAKTKAQHEAGILRKLIQVKTLVKYLSAKPKIPVARRGRDIGFVPLSLVGPS